MGLAPDGSPLILLDRSTSDLYALDYPRAVDRDEMLRALRAFEREGLEYVLIGAAAMRFHGLVRATEDLDVFSLEEE